MLRLTPTAETLRPAPLVDEERVAAVRALLDPHGIYARRWGYAQQSGVTITYVHLSEPANGRIVTSLLADGLDWQDTDMASVAGTVIVTTTHG